MMKAIDRPRKGVLSGLLLPEIEAGLTRREFLIGTGLLVLAPGCGSAEEAANGGASGEIRTIEHKYGSTEISGTPERVVSVGYTDQDTMLALRVTPVGVREWFGDQPYATWPWARGELGDATPEVLPTAELNFEQIATLEPDLILAVYSGITDQEYETLSEIAPTVAQSGEYIDYTTPWQEQTRVIGRALGKEERAEELVADVEAMFAEAREQHPEFEGATGVVADGGAEAGTYGILGPDDPRGRFLTSLGFRYPDEVAELVPEDSFSASPSRERLDLLDDLDVLIWLIYAEEQRSIETEPVFEQLDVVQRDAVLLLDNGQPPLNAAISFSTVLSLPFALDELVPQIAAAVDGAIETTERKEG